MGGGLSLGGIRGRVGCGCGKGLIVVGLRGRVGCHTQQSTNKKHQTTKYKISNDKSQTINTRRWEGGQGTTKQVTTEHKQ